MSAILQAITGTVYSGGPPGVSPIGGINWNNTNTPFTFRSGNGSSITSVSYDFPDGTTANTLQYDGTGYQVTPSLGVVDNFWLDFWIYPTSFGGAILSELNSAEFPGYYYNMLEIDNSGHIYAGIWTGGNITNIVSTDTVTLNAWNHIYFYYDSGTLYLQVSGGSPVTATGLSRSGPGETFIGVGQGTVTAMFTSNYYQGYIETIYGSTTSVSSRYNSTKSKYQAQQLMALQASSYTSGSTWTDTIGSKAFALQNSPTWSNTNGGQFRFDAASSQYATLDQGAGFNTLPSWSLQSVVKLHTLPSYGAPCIITEFWQRLGQYKINFAQGCLNTTPNLQGGFFDASAGYWNVSNAVASPVVDTWYDIVTTYHGPTHTLKEYVNGVYIGSTPCPGTPESVNPGLVIAKRWDNPDFLDCTIKDINIWSGVLTQSEVSALHSPYSSLA